MVFYVLATAAVLMALPLLMPGRIALALLSVTGAGLLGYAWVWLWGELSHPDVSGFGAAIALMSLFIPTLAFVSGVAGRTAGLVLQARGRTRRQVLWTDAAVAVPVVFLVVLSFF